MVGNNNKKENSSAFKIGTWVETNVHEKCKGNDGVLGPNGQQGLYMSPRGSVGLDESGSKKHCSGGVYTGPRLANIEKNVKEVQALNNEQRGTEGADVAKAMLTWKHKERDWLKGSEEKTSKVKGKTKRK
jgi:hypothetical protein